MWRSRQRRWLERRAGGRIRRSDGDRATRPMNDQMVSSLTERRLRSTRVCQRKTAHACGPPRSGCDGDPAVLGAHPAPLRSPSTCHRGRSSRSRAATLSEVPVVGGDDRESRLCLRPTASGRWGGGGWLKGEALVSLRPPPAPRVPRLPAVSRHARRKRGTGRRADSVPRDAAYCRMALKRLRDVRLFAVPPLRHGSLLGPPGRETRRAPAPPPGGRAARPGRQVRRREEPDLDLRS